MMKKTKGIVLAKGLRQTQTEAEKILWSKLRNRQLDMVKFRRQQLIGNYIIDFVSFDKKLIIEIDGGQHNEFQKTVKDAQRTTWLNSEGFRMIRFWNNDITQNIEGVLLNIKEIIKERNHPHLASPIKGEE